MSGNVPILDSVGGAMRFVRENLRVIVMAGGAGALATAVLTGLALFSPIVSVFASAASSFVQASVYAFFVGAFLFGAAAARGRMFGDGWRVWAAMVVVGFFMFIVMFIISIPVMIVLFAGPLAPYVDDLQSAGGDQAAVMQVMLDFAEANPGALLLVMLFYSAVWLLLTSRLYLAAPASVDQGRILTFETWGWTKGAMLRITAARLMLLLPANVLAFAIGHLAGRLIGVDSTNAGAMAGAASANPAGYLIYVLVSVFVTFALYSSLEAGLSSYIYRGLKPPEPAKAA